MVTLTRFRALVWVGVVVGTLFGPWAHAQRIVQIVDLDRGVLGVVVRDDSRTILKTFDIATNKLETRFAIDKPVSVVRGSRYSGAIMLTATEGESMTPSYWLSRDQFATHSVVPGFDAVRALQQGVHAIAGDFYVVLDNTGEVPSYEIVHVEVGNSLGRVAVGESTSKTAFFPQDCTAIETVHGKRLLMLEREMGRNNGALRLFDVPSMRLLNVIEFNGIPQQLSRGAGDTWDVSVIRNKQEHVMRFHVENEGTSLHKETLVHELDFEAPWIQVASGIAAMHQSEGAPDLLLFEIAQPRPNEEAIRVKSDELLKLNKDANWLLTGDGKHLVVWENGARFRVLRIAFPEVSQVANVVVD